MGHPIQIKTVVAASTLTHDQRHWNNALTRERPFLAARWANLCLFNYEVDEAVLRPRLPRGFALDRWQGRVFVSVVAFQFLETRVLGVRWPGFVDFPEINLRFYVVAPDGRRGVVFIREYVPSRLVGWVARAAYNEPYSAAAMTMGVERGVGEAGTLRMRYGIGRRDVLGVITAEVDAAAVGPASEGSLEHHFKEHQWGFGVSRRGHTLVYEVRHPHWRTHRVRSATCEIDWQGLYGPEWAFMRDAKAESMVVAEGSGVEVLVGGRYGVAGE